MLGFWEGVIFRWLLLILVDGADTVGGELAFYDPINSQNLLQYSC